MNTFLLNKKMKGDIQMKNHLTWPGTVIAIVTLNIALHLLQTFMVR